MNASVSSAGASPMTARSGWRERVEGELPGCDDAQRRNRADDLEGPRDDRAQPVGAGDLPGSGRDQPRRGRRGLRDPGHTHAMDPSGIHPVIG